VRRRGDLQIRSVTLKQTVPQFQTCAFSSRTSMLHGSFWTRPLPLEDSPHGLLVGVRIGNLAASSGDTVEMSRVVRSMLYCKHGPNEEGKRTVHLVCAEIWPVLHPYGCGVARSSRALHSATRVSSQSRFGLCSQPKSFNMPKSTGS
jgi:hypothetical protein